MLTPRLRPAAFLLLATAPFVVLACAPAPPSGPGRALPPKPEQVVLGDGGQVDRNKVLEAGRKQEYDDNPGASDQDVLDDGVIAVIEPQVGAYGIDTLMLAQGVVVARFKDLGDTPLERLSLVPRLTTFWYIYRKEGKLFSAYVVDSPDSQVGPVRHPDNAASSKDAVVAVDRSVADAGRAATGMTRRGLGLACRRADCPG